MLRETPRQVPVRVRILLRWAFQGAVHDTEGGHEAPARARGEGQSPSFALSHRCTWAAVLRGSARYHRP